MQAGRGRDHFAADPDEAPAIFAEEFENLSSLVGQNLSVEIRPLSPALNVGILNEYPVTNLGNALQAALGDVYGGENRKVIFQLKVPALADLGQVQVAEVVIRWTDITGDEAKLHTRTIPITVNVVAPGLVDTDMTRAVSDKAQADWTALIPLQRLGTPRDIAAAVCFLASDEGAYITGQVLNVNGGMYM